MKTTYLSSASLCVIGCFVSFSSIAALFGRLETSPGSGIYQAYYDDQLDITWATDANINGRDGWDNQIAWVSGLTIGGITGWRLPNMNVDGDGLVFDCISSTQEECRDNEYGHLFYYGAGTTWGSGITSASPSPFYNVEPGFSSFYWSSTDVPPPPTPTAFAFNFDFGNLTIIDTDEYLYAWAVHDGDVSMVPVPAAVWLFGFGLLVLFGLSKSKNVT